jgi:hypothetical protein
MADRYSMVSSETSRALESGLADAVQLRAASILVSKVHFRAVFEFELEPHFSFCMRSKSNIDTIPMVPWSAEGFRCVSSVKTRGGQWAQVV